MVNNVELRVPPFSVFIDKFEKLDSNFESPTKIFFSNYADIIEEVIFELGLSVALSDHYILLHNLSEGVSKNDFDVKFQKYIDKIQIFKSKVISIRTTLSSIKEYLIINNDHILRGYIISGYQTSDVLLRLLYECIDSFVVLLQRIKLKLDPKSKELYHGFEYKIDLTEISQTVWGSIATENYSTEKKLRPLIDLCFYVSYIEDEITCSESNIQKLRRLNSICANLKNSNKFKSPVFDVIQNKVKYLCFKVERRRNTGENNIDSDKFEVDQSIFVDFYKRTKHQYIEYKDEVRDIAKILKIYKNLIGEYDNKELIDNSLLVHYHYFGKLFKHFSNDLLRVSEKEFKNIHRVFDSIDIASLNSLQLEIENSYINTHAIDSFEVRKLFVKQEFNLKLVQIRLKKESKSLNIGAFTNLIDDFITEIKKVDNEIDILQNKYNNFTKYFIKYRQLELLNEILSYFKDFFDKLINLAANEDLIKLSELYKVLENLQENTFEKIQLLFSELEIARQQKADPIFIDFENCLYNYTFRFSEDENSPGINRIGFLDSSYILPIDFSNCKESLNTLKSSLNFNMNTLLHNISRKQSFLIDINNAKDSFKDSIKEVESKTQYNTMQIVSVFIAVITFVMGSIKITYDTLLSFPQKLETEINIGSIKNSDSIVHISKKDFDLILKSTVDKASIITTYTSKVIPVFVLALAVTLLLFVFMNRLIFANLRKSTLIFIIGGIMFIAAILFLYFSIISD
jgi:hypothetical protein